MGQRTGRPRHRPGRELGPRRDQRVGLGERPHRAPGVRAAPDPLAPQHHDRGAERRCVMDPVHPPAVTGTATSTLRQVGSPDERSLGPTDLGGPDTYIPRPQRTPAPSTSTTLDSREPLKDSTRSPTRSAALVEMCGPPAGHVQDRLLAHLCHGLPFQAQRFPALTYLARGRHSGIASPKRGQGCAMVDSQTRGHQPAGLRKYVCNKCRKTYDLPPAVQGQTRPCKVRGCEGVLERVGRGSARAGGLE